MRPKAKGNIAVAKAIYYFSLRNYYVFSPIGDDGGTVDLIVSLDGFTLHRVQCKYSQKLQTSMHKRYPDSPVYQVDLRQVMGQPTVEGKRVSIMKYTDTSFDLLFVTTPTGDYLFNWQELCLTRGKPPTGILIGKKMLKYKI